MADIRLAIQDVSREGVAATYSGVTTTDTYLINNDGRVILHVKNAGTGAETVTLKTGKTYLGLAIEDPTVTVGASSDKFIGPFETEVFNDGQDMKISFSVGTSVTVAALKV